MFIFQNSKVKEICVMMYKCNEAIREKILERNNFAFLYVCLLFLFVFIQQDLVSAETVKKERFMSPSLENIKKHMSEQIIVPAEFDEFYHWSQKQINKYDHHCSISGSFEWRADDYEALNSWFGLDVSDRFGVFGAGSTGNLYAFWIDDDGEQKIVHLGSEGGELHILGENFAEFLRFLAIGYEDTYEDYFEMSRIEVLKHEYILGDLSFEAFIQDVEDIEKLKSDEGLKELFELEGNYSDDLNEIKDAIKEEVFTSFHSYEEYYAHLEDIVKSKQNNNTSTHITMEQLQELYDDTMKLKTDEGLRALFGADDIPQDVIEMMKEINENADYSYLEPTQENLDRMNSQMDNNIKDDANNFLKQNKMLKEFQQWVKDRFQVTIPRKGRELPILSDRSFENWVEKIISDHEKITE